MTPRKRKPRQHLGALPDSMIGKHVSFGAPKDVKARGGRAAAGRILDEVWVPDEEGGRDSAWGTYCFFAQRIRWDGGRHSIRLGYYRRRKGEGHWEFASQTTVNSNPRTIQRLLRETLDRRDWFD